MQKRIITIDGTAASGKGTVAKIIADKLHLDYFDSGIVYRKLAHDLMHSGIALNDTANILAYLQEFDLNIDPEELPKLRTDEVSKGASIVAAIATVREKLIQLQRNFAANSENGLVADGRDMGTVIFPDAEFKFFLTAKIEERAKRRYNQLRLENNNVIFAQVVKDLRDRDQRDASRSSAPMKPALDAVVIDSSHMAINEVVDRIINRINDKQV
ncbi:(d)CMP kinase [Rickettsiales endosymbiont of Stachyamoeba lipophora]|uniref:(d)CMP kinase n=1 Tax=Rickettsiales endosymbiont of Stachyamoeba lipophora TaxID=2486578 RepID=UPI000F6541D4|nr:(d)CMP kinase [Rickettsiales endosymbiont of Stachyamoeba lipophora]AZL15831.1 (d)CMP kinase [Rickettsiales endosymbiont of Stachyamoeba lipophora]